MKDLTSIIRPMLSKEQIELIKAQPHFALLTTLAVHDGVVNKWRTEQKVRN